MKPLIVRRFKVASVSPGVTPRGLYGHLLIARNGDTFTAFANAQCKRNVGDELIVAKISHNVYDWMRYRLLGVRPGKPASPEATRELWNTTAIGPHEKIIG